jgi:hypothetical protein
MNSSGVSVLKQDYPASSISCWAGAFSALGPVLASVTQTEQGLSHNAVLKSFDLLEDSLKNLKKPGEDIFATDTLVDAGGDYTLSGLAFLALEKLGFEGEDEILVQTLLAASVLGEIPHTLSYHNTAHFRKVLYHAIRLIVTDRTLSGPAQPGLSKEQAVLLMIAACIHDLGHDGSSNIASGQYEPGRLEQRSCALAEPYLTAAGMSEGALSYLRTMVLCTDASRPDNPSCPLSQLKAAYHHHFSDFSGKSEHSAGQVFAFLRNRKDLTLLAMYLHEADIMSSAGVSYERTQCETIQFKQERGEGAARPSDVLEFFDTICRGGFLTRAGKALAQRPYESIRAAVELDFESGNAVYRNQESC